MLNNKDLYLTKDLENIFSNTFEFSISEKIKVITIDTIIYLLLNNNDIKNMIKKEFNVDTNTINNKILEYLKIEVVDEKEITDLEFSLDIKDLIQKLKIYQKITKNNEINVFNCLKTILKFESYSLNILYETIDIDKYDFENILSKYENYENPKTIIENQLEKIIEKNNEKKGNSFLIDLKEKNKLKKVIGREKEVQRIINIMGKKENSDCIVLSEQSVGKTTLINKIIEMSSNKEYNKNIKNYNFFKLNKKEFLLNLKFKHDFDLRINNIVNFLNNLEKESVLFIDDLDILLNQFSDIKDSLSLIFSNNKIKLLATSSIKNFNKLKKEMSLDTYLTSYILKELPYEETLEVLKIKKIEFETYHNKKVSNEILEYIYEVSKKYLNTKQPLSSINLLDESLSTKKNNKNSSKELTKEDVDVVLSNVLNLNLNVLKKQNDNNLLELKEKIQSKIFNQDLSIEKIVDTIIVNKAGLTKDKKPIASFLLISSTGTGKTELAKVLSNELSMNLLHYNMSEYIENHSVSRFIGSPSGYVGYEEGGMLVNDVIENPNSVILIDEIEKANKSVINLFLQILEEAEIQDGRGVKADFRNTIIIMTSNAGYDNQKLMGFLKDEQGKVVSKVNETFPKEFINRLDEILYFNPITKEIMLKIIEKNKTEINELLSKNNNKINFEENLIQYLIEKGYDNELGARPVYRLIKKEILTLISKEIVFNKSKDTIFNMDIDNGIIFIKDKKDNNAI